MENGPAYVQWNIALYDDDIFWVVPKSHRAPDSDELKQQLLRDSHVEVPGAFQARLRAGDAIVYASFILHWGSPYTSRMRRVIHHGYGALDRISSFALHPHWNMNLEFTRHLSAESRAAFERMAAMARTERDRYAAILRTALTRDVAAFRDQLAASHPRQSYPIAAVAHLCRLATQIELICGSRAEQLTPEQYGQAEGGYGDHFWSDFKRRFPPPDADALGARFASFTATMLRDREASERHNTALYRQLKPEANEPPNFETRSLRTHYTQMPEGYDVEDFISSWAEAPNK